MASGLPDYVASAKPVPKENRIPWFSSTAQTYAGIMLWFVFWQDVPTGGGSAGGALAQGVGVALVGLVLAALLCHFLYYVVPGMLGMKTGLPLYIVGTSTYGVRGGFAMPGLLMGVLQFGWLGVNACFAAVALVAPWTDVADPLAVIGTAPHMAVSVLWAIAAAFMGLKGIQYVAKVASFLPLIPLGVLLLLFVSTVGGIGSFDAQPAIDAAVAANPKAVTLTTWGVIALMLTYIIGFFATAGAAGCDFGMNNRDAKDVQMGGLVGIAGSTVFAGGLALLIVAGAHGLGKVSNPAQLNPTGLMADVLGVKMGAVCMYGLAIAAFPPACFSAFIAANSFKTVMPKINPFATVGLGTVVSIILAVTGWAAKVVAVFQVIGASFGPVCGAMAADYLLAGKKWAGPRAALNPAGWISWLVGFAVGAFNLVAGWIPALENYKEAVPVPPLTAFIVGFVLYAVLAKAGLESKQLEMPAGDAAPEPAAE